MEVKELQEKKKQLEDDIIESLHQFVDDTGLNLDDINFSVSNEQSLEVSKPHQRYQVNIKLDI